MGWHRWVGPKGRVLGIDRYGASAPEKAIYENLGLTASRRWRAVATGDVIEE